ncbi:phosphatidylglycerophosphatase A [Ralstonia solanacearum]|uniref:Phosphatidylglycerophosphatase A n=1 Tax=Ralstonia solanacearum TaxID=305 RepID=A0A0S4VDX7_RALSL|nr:phosphatidylglycerophosphatase A [Ralstonia solanacearum]AXW14186.1 phosphatidylglycerophosphatase A [Ralstonia solanacearum]CUV32835.1 Phosphatidylglycerophosphatase A [Ralstonia solanacearum]
MVLEAGQTAQVRRPTARFMFGHPARILALGFGSGLSPVMPGTMGTLYAWLVYAVLSRWIAGPGWLLIAAIGFVIGIGACARTARDLGVADHGAMVWDEMVAFWLVLAFVTPTTLGGQFAAFLWFRFFDMVKPAPIRYYDRALKGFGLRGGYGVMVDDILAAFYTLLVFALWRSF